MLNSLLQEKNLTKYRLSKLSDIPYTTINDICSGRADIRKCSVDTVYRIAGALDTTIETLLAPYYIERPDFELFKSSVCHQLKELGDIDFIVDILSGKSIDRYYERKWYPESLYLLAMLDYVSSENNIPLCEEYAHIRSKKLAVPLYPASVLAIRAAEKDDSILKDAEKKAIPEFMRHNIIESEVRDVI